MKRLGTTPRRRPTVACSPTIGHRTPKAPVSQDISYGWTSEDAEAFKKHIEALFHPYAPLP